MEYYRYFIYIKLIFNYFYLNNTCKILVIYFILQYGLELIKKKKKYFLEINF